MNSPASSSDPGATGGSRSGNASLVEATASTGAQGSDAPSITPSSSESKKTESKKTESKKTETEKAETEKTEVGSYFISNYPPYSFWSADHVPAARAALETANDSREPLGLYLHIPFCRKRCKFCYFRVYTDKNSKDVERYVEAIAREVELYAALPSVASRRLGFVYFGGGTPSFLSAKQLLDLVARLRRSVDWDGADEVTFECEPGTLTEKKLEAIRDIGVTRLSLGVENFDDEILEVNGRAHRSPECHTAYGWARSLGFEQINIDLIAGMVGETDENWQLCIERALEMAPDCLTIYQMELPYNTVYSREGAGGSGAVADWPTKRRWVDEAFTRFREAGYRVSSAYTVVKSPDARFVYRDALWRGADLIGAGVASFGHLAPVPDAPVGAGPAFHLQNLDHFEPYIEALERGELPLARALEITPHQRLVRELILQMKTGRVEATYFRQKFGAEILTTFASALADHSANGLLRVDRDGIDLTPTGMLRVDSLLEAFFEDAHRGARYT